MTGHRYAFGVLVAAAAGPVFAQPSPADERTASASVPADGESTGGASDASASNATASATTAAPGEAPEGAAPAAGGADAEPTSDGGPPTSESEPERPIDPRAVLLAERGWPAGAIQSQLDRDATLVPFGKGAIFVPAMTNPLDEPPVSVWQEEQKLAEGTTGRRIVVLPGRYRVEMGSGAGEQRFSVMVDVREMNVSVVPVTWAGLAVHVADERFNSLRGSYEVIRVDSREYVDVGFGADEQAGEPVTTWILPPGLYKIVRVGETYRARRDFATVRLRPGHLTDFLLVVDEATDAFKGAGEVPRDELFLAGKDTFAWSLVFGGDVNMNSRQSMIGRPDGESFAFRGFLDTKLTAFLFESPLILQLQVEEGALVAGNLFNPRSETRSVPFQKTHDRADLDGLYVYKLFPWLGPYARFNVETNFIETLQYFEEPTRVLIYDSDGSFRRARPVSDRVRLLPSFGLTSIKEGIGIHLRVFKALFGETTVRVGVGARHQITQRLLEPALEIEPSPDEPPLDGTPVLRYQQVPTVQQIGVEATVLSTLRITRYVLVNIEFDTLVPFDDIENVVVDIEATLAVKLTSFVSVNYVFRFLRDPSLSVAEEVPNRFENDLLIRFSVELP